MDASLSPEQEDLRRVLRRFLAERSGSAAVRRAVETPAGYDEAVWRQLNEAFGLAGVVIPEEYGGLGLGFVELALVLEEMGRALYPSPFLAGAVLAAAALLHSGDEPARKEFLPGIAAGTTAATLAHRSCEVAVRPAAGPGAAMTGTVQHVLDGHLADLLILPVPSASGVSLYAVRGDAPGLSTSRLPTVDQTRTQARLELRDTPARLLGVAGGAATVLDRVRDLGGVALAAEAVGGAARCLEMAVEYARTRVQFGRPIGGFQAVKHRCADLYVEVETARSAAYYAAWTAAAGSEELATMAPAAQAYCAEVYRHVAADNIQLHGGIGFTWEHDAHLYFKRASTADVLFGSSRYQRAVLAERLGLARPPNVVTWAASSR
jgi:alkylation response protein AidB-like acyl-CoA dehydrogenase